MNRFHRYILGAAVAALLTFSEVALRSAPVTAPGSVPSRIILTWAGDPARTQAVTWRTATPLPAPQAQIAKFTADPGFEKSAVTVNGATETDDLGGGQSARSDRRHGDRWRDRQRRELESRFVGHGLHRRSFCRQSS